MNPGQPTLSVQVTGANRCLTAPLLPPLYLHKMTSKRSLTIGVQQLQTVMYPIVCLLPIRLLKHGQKNCVSSWLSFACGEYVAGGEGSDSHDKPYHPTTTVASSLVVPHLLSLTHTHTHAQRRENERERRKERRESD